ncbi:DUF4192 domain-containing protein [Phytohabitans rumicis]|uniref:DUF4192 domain-containing protein n=1 Tax=Phytohabitans rumicis TaxID=1076125 RepID=A0A6V8LGR5_9ACTN|nr:DUF4192 domain-containing protein [Phytohabitans rumicis]GFJ93306.1 hypothetical protein Prum_069480 [Phytohabitans rumicis]
MSNHENPITHQPPPPRRIRVVATSPADLLALVPYLLGFHPHQSLVALGFTDDELVVATRGDLPTQDDPANAVDLLIGQMTRLVTNSRCTTVHLFGYGSPDLVEPVLRAAADGFADAGLEVIDLVRVTSDRYFSLRSPGPDEGVPFEVGSNILAAYAIAAGQVAFPDRDSLARTIEAVDGPEQQAMTRATIAAAERLNMLIATDGTAAAIRAGKHAVTEAFDRYAAGGRLDDNEMGWLTVQLINPEVREHAWLLTDDRSWHEQLWRDTTRRALLDLVAHAAALLAFTAWRRGDGVLANLAARRALDADPGNRLATLIDQVLAAGLSPATLIWPPDQPPADDTPDTSDLPDRAEPS